MKSYKKQNIYIPQIGWNELSKANKSELMNELNKQSFYFVNSYYVDPEDKDIIKFNYLHGKFYPAIIKDNIFATQFHPEKSDNDFLFLKIFMTINTKLQKRIIPIILVDRYHSY